MNSISVEQLTKSFGSFTSVDSISFTVGKGEIFGFLGANGAGKSTTIKMLCGLLEPSSGDAIVAGYSISKQPEAVKQHIGYMSQRFSLYNDMSVKENIAFFGGVYGLEGAALRNRMQDVLTLSGLQGEENRLTGDLPGGIKQRLALGTAVLHQPEIVFLDEPTSGVDPIARRSFWDLIYDLSARGTTVFVTTHYLEEAEYCGNLILINAGKIIAEGTPKHLKEHYISGSIYELRSSAPLPLMEALRTLPGVDEVSLFGMTIHVLLREGVTTPDALRQQAERITGITVPELTLVEPSLEDVFIHLLDQQGVKL